MNLILSPHWDDEVLGCTSYLDGDATVVYFTQGHSAFPGWKAEMEKLVNEAGIETVPLDYPIHHLDKVPQAKLITVIEEILRTFKPDRVAIPFQSYNQDHRAVHEAALTAMRPNDKQHFVKRILVYEEPDVFGTLGKVFTPNYFRLIDIERKIALCKIYQSQMRDHRSPDLLWAMAQVRGMQAGLPYAEGFQVLRWVE